MSITLTDTGLESDLEQLGQAQDVPAKKHTIAYAILRDAVARWKVTDDPRSWRADPAVSNGDQPTEASQSSIPDQSASTPDAA